MARAIPLVVLQLVVDARALEYDSERRRARNSGGGGGGDSGGDSTAAPSSRRAADGRELARRLSAEG